MRISVDQAREYFQHPSQQREGVGLMPDQLHDDGVTYYATEHMCLLVHEYEGEPMVHIAVKPEGWGRLDDPCVTLLTWVQADWNADRLLALIDENNRAVVRMANAVGFTGSQQVEMVDKLYTLKEWRRCLHC